MVRNKLQMMENNPEQDESLNSSFLSWICKF